MKGFRLLNCLLVILIVMSFSHGSVSYAAGGAGTVYDTIQKQNKTPNSTQTKPIQKRNKPTNQTHSSPALPKSDAGGTFLTFLKLFLALGVVLFLIYLFYRFLSKRTRSFQHVGQIRNLGGVSVGANRSVQLVKIGNEVLILGIGENVSLIKEVDDPDVLESFVNQQEPVTLRPNVSKWVEWAKANTKLKSLNVGTKPKFKAELDQILEAREKGLEELLKKEPPPHD